MVARIHTAQSFKKVLNYHEQKVRNGVAVCLEAAGFLKEASRLSFYDKWLHFKRLTDLNERTRTHTLHVSLNFDSSETISEKKLVAIAGAYMRGIGFGEQPYLVYRHEDAGHPHIHLVSVSIRPDGRRISMHGLGRGASERTRLELEKAYKLVPAQGSRKCREGERPLQKVIYGKGELKPGIAAVLQGVLNAYRYTSLPELNAVLRLYHVEADGGAEGSRIKQRGGIVYRALDKEGNRVGSPLKASLLPGNPGLSFLEKCFQRNSTGREALLPKVRAVISPVVEDKKIKDWQGFQKALSGVGVDTVLRQNAEGYVYGITYVDHRNKAVFNGSALGKEYSPKGLTNRWNDGSGVTTVPAISLPGQHLPSGTNCFETDAKENVPGLLETLLQPQAPGEVAPAWRFTKRKRKGRRPKN
ncbi:MAG: relaxase [Flaviaesturariibacter sp.]|nr:relaxase [Flaviaesturariibacter sp.]